MSPDSLNKNAKFCSCCVWRDFLQSVKSCLWQILNNLVLLAKSAISVIHEEISVFLWKQCRRFVLVMYIFICIQSRESEIILQDRHRAVHLRSDHWRRMSAPSRWEQTRWIQMQGTAGRQADQFQNIIPEWITGAGKYNFRNGAAQQIGKKTWL